VKNARHYCHIITRVVRIDFIWMRTLPTMWVALRISRVA
jgi:hypothetical protein